ncbi:MarR family transcriptional regulator [Streptomyces sp. NPDC050856]|uniref:MarR family winged helix-turn-helix transcriptional regulator n=1 Tax=Streptomyces sp. NPDC050856 TaxID=3154939 RepID=UPI0033C140B5
MPQRLTGLPSVPAEGSCTEDSPGTGQDGAARAVREVTDLLEVLWSDSRDKVPTAPVSSSQLKALYVLDHHEGINLRSLGEVLGSAPSSVSRMCDRLQALGFIERSPSSASRRELELRLTNRGAKYLAGLRARREAVLWEVVSAMTPSARRALVQGLSGFRRAADRLAPGAGEADGATETA